MWIYFNDTFVSIVRSTNDPEKLHIRARKRYDIERFLGFRAVDFAWAIKETSRNDYKFRVDVPRDVVATTLLRRAMEIDYDDFKKSVKDKQRHTVYERIWGASHALEGDNGPP